MNKKLFLHMIIGVSVTTSVSLLQADCGQSCNNPKVIFIPRSQSVNAARDLCGEQKYINQPQQHEDHYFFDNIIDEIYGCFATTFEYTRSFRPNLLTNYLFGNAANNGKITFSGSTVADRGSHDILADYFGLPQDFQSTIHFTPRISNYIVDFDLYCGLENAFFRVTAPFVHTIWSINPDECIINEGTQAFPASYMAQNAVPRSELPTSAIAAWSGCTTFGDMQTPLQYGKLAPHGKSLTAMSEIQLALGWNFINNIKSHAGFAIRASLPTGNAPHSKYFFEPIVGNCGHYELGLGFTSHVRLWNNEESNKSLTLYFDINGTHLFANTQIRSFDFYVNGPGSRYILAAQYQDIQETPNDLNPHGSVTNPGTESEYSGSLTPAINITTLCTNVSIQLQADAVLKLAYNCNNFEFDIGYNFWGRTAERVRIINDLTQSQYGLKGDAFMYGAADPTGANNVIAARAAYAANDLYSRIPLGASQQEGATLFIGANYANNKNSPAQLNPGVDHDEAAYTGINPITFEPTTIVYSPIAGIGDNTTAIQTSNPVGFINQLDQIDITSATAPSASSHKLFINSSYNWDETTCHNRELKLFLSLGFEAEFDAKRKYLGSQSCECAAALNQWGAWLKGGVGF